MKMLNELLTIEVNIAEAILILNFTEKLDSNNFVNLNKAERQALWNLGALLEKELTEPRIADFQSTLEAATKIFSQDD